MKTPLFIVFFTILFYSPLFSQIGINTETPDPATVLDIHSENAGVLLPRMDPNSVINPPEGLLVYDTINKCVSQKFLSGWKCLKNSSSKKTFYPPGVNLDMDTLIPDSNGYYSYDVYDNYLSVTTSPKSIGGDAPELEVYTRDQLNFYLLDYDTTSFSEAHISEQGVLTFKKLSTYNNSSSYFTIVFSVK